MLPIEIVNIILVYISELNNSTMITQYNPYTNKEYYKINFNSDLLWNIKSTLVMKRFYRIHSFDFSNNGNIELYKSGKAHYKKKLQEKAII